MAKTPDFKKLKTLNPSVTEHTYRYLQRLKRSGLHGSTESEVARILIQDQIKYLVSKGALPMEFSPDDGEEEDVAGKAPA